MGDLRCAHAGDETVRTLCVPLMAQGTALGVLHVRDSAANRKDGEEDANSASQALAETVAEQAALSLANLRLRDELRELSISDPLTSLYNRRFAQETLACEIHRAHREQGAIGIITFDIDYFKSVNDSYGHDAGDAVLGPGAAARGLLEPEQLRLARPPPLAPRDDELLYTVAVQVEGAAAVGVAGVRDGRDHFGSVGAAGERPLQEAVAPGEDTLPRAAAAVDGVGDVLRSQASENHVLDVERERIGQQRRPS